MSSDIRSHIDSILTTAQMNIVSGDIDLAIANLRQVNNMSKHLSQNDPIFDRFHQVVSSLPVGAKEKFYHVSKHGNPKIRAHAGMSLGLSDQSGDLAYEQGYMADDAIQAIANVTADVAASVAKNVEKATTKAPDIGNISIERLRADCSLQDAIGDAWNNLGLGGKALVVAGGYLLVKKCLLS